MDDKMSNGHLMLGDLIQALVTEFKANGDQTVALRTDTFNSFATKIQTSGGKGVALVPGENL